MTSGRLWFTCLALAALFLSTGTASARKKKTEDPLLDLLPAVSADGRRVVVYSRWVTSGGYRPRWSASAKARVVTLRGSRLLEERFPSEGTIEDALKEGGFAALPVRYLGETFDEEGRGSVGVLRVALQPKRHPRTLALLWGRRVLGRQALPASWSGLSGNDWKERWQMVTTDLAVALPASPRNVVLVGVTRSAPVTTRRRRCNDCKRTQELEWFIMRVSAAARRQLARLLHD